MNARAIRRAPPALLVLALCGAASPAELPGFRMDHYRAPVPETLQGARVMHTGALASYIAASHPLLIDVLPAPTPPEDGRPGLPRLPVAHFDLPGSLWWPDIGRGALAPTAEIRLKILLREATANDTARPIVFYCLSACWMSWNAAKRAITYGYSAVIWAPDGADGWQAAGLPTAIAHPLQG